MTTETTGYIELNTMVASAYHLPYNVTEAEGTAALIAEAKAIANSPTYNKTLRSDYAGTPDPLDPFKAGATWTGGVMSGTTPVRYVVHWDTTQQAVVATAIGEIMARGLFASVSGGMTFDENLQATINYALSAGSLSGATLTAGSTPESGIDASNVVNEKIERAINMVRQTTTPVKYYVDQTVGEVIPADATGRYAIRLENPISAPSYALEEWGIEPGTPALGFIATYENGVMMRPDDDLERIHGELLLIEGTEFWQDPGEGVDAIKRRVEGATIITVPTGVTDHAHLQNKLGNGDHHLSQEEAGWVVINKGKVVATPTDINNAVNPIQQRVSTVETGKLDQVVSHGGGVSLVESNGANSVQAKLRDVSGTGHVSASINSKTGAVEFSVSGLATSAELQTETNNRTAAVNAIEQQITALQNKDSVQDDAINAKVNTTDFNDRRNAVDGELASRVTTTVHNAFAESTNNALATKVAQTEYNGKVQALENKDATQDAAINNKVDSSTFDARTTHVNGELDKKLEAQDVTTKMVVDRIANGNCETVKPAAVKIFKCMEYLPIATNTGRTFYAPGFWA